MLWLGSGVIGGVGLGLGYISPVSTLIKWFPDRRGMATGMAIMGFGGGAMIGSPLATFLMSHFKTRNRPGCRPDLHRHGRNLLRVHADRLVRLPPAARRLEARGLDAARPTATRMITSNNVHLDNAHKTPQFWLLWLVLCLNVSAGIGIIGAASPHASGDLRRSARERDPSSPISTSRRTRLSRRRPQPWARASSASSRCSTSSAASPGRRRRTGSAARLPTSSSSCSAPACTCWPRYAAEWKILGLFVACFCIIASMYGGGFATIPAYLADMFGTQFVGAIHGLLLTAWSTAGILGPVVVNYLHDTRLGGGRCAGSDLQPDLLHPGRHAGARLHRQPAREPGQRRNGT